MPRFRSPAAPAVLRPALLLLALAAAGSIGAQETREQAVHAHGTTQVTLAIVDGALELELTAPGMDLVGFEHAPATPQQDQAIAAANATLEGSGDWLAFEPAGSCTVASADAHTHGFKAEVADDAQAQAGHGGHDGDHGHDHDDGHEGHDHAGGHGEFHLKLTGTCSATPQALRIDLASRFPGIERIRVDLITDSVQDRVELGAGQTRVPLAR